MGKSYTKKRPDVIEWLRKAEQDYETAVTMARKRKMPVPDIVGFHSQQCIEKYLKAFLVLKSRTFQKLMTLVTCSNSYSKRILSWKRYGMISAFSIPSLFSFVIRGNLLQSLILCLQ